MTRVTLTQDLEQLQQDLLTMSTVVVKQVEAAVSVVEQRDGDLAAAIAERDSEVDRLRYMIEELCLDLLATQGPVASDLRVIASALIIANELERIGDYAEGICRLAIKLLDQPRLTPPVDLPHMSVIACEMLDAVMRAFVDRDAVVAQRVWERDDELDGLYQQAIHALLDRMYREPATISSATYLLWVAHNLERIGDRVGNIAERVVFLVTGYLDRHSA